MIGFSGILTAARTMAYYSRRQEVTANNLANANTAGFKADRLVAHRPGDMDSPVPVEATDLGQGALRMTGRPLDLAIEGKGFLVVETPGGERLIRGGSLKLDGQGTLITDDGSPVLGKQGRIVVTQGSIEIGPDLTDAYALIKLVNAQIPALPIDVLVNRAIDSDDATRAFERLAVAADRFLGKSITAIGGLGEIAALRDAMRRPGGLLADDGLAALRQDVAGIVARIPRDIESSPEPIPAGRSG